MNSSFVRKKSLWRIAHGVWSERKSMSLCYRQYAISHTLLSSTKYASRITRPL